MEATNTNTLQQLLNNEIGCFIMSEQLLVEVLSRWIEKTKTLSLKTVLQDYLSRVGQHLERLETFANGEKVGLFALLQKS